MAESHVCPWWLGYFLASPIRRFFTDPGRILEPYVRVGMTVIEPGPGMCFFTLELARRVGASGRVLAVDIQPRMIAGLRRRAARAQLLDRIETRLATPQSMMLDGLERAADFLFAFAMVHETPDAAAFFAQAASAMKPGASLLLAEPTGHVSAEQFEGELKLAASAGLVAVDRPTIRRSHAACLKKA